MKRMKQLIIGLALVIGLSAILLPSTGVSAVDVIGEACANNSSSTICENKDDNIGSIINIVINVLLFLVGAISVIMIIVSGIRYVTSAGDAAAVAGAKNTLLYAIVGLVVAFIAFAIVNWVVKLFA
jgi:hypothetical protein